MTRAKEETSKKTATYDGVCVSDTEGYDRALDIAVARRTRYETEEGERITVPRFASVPAFCFFPRHSIKPSQRAAHMSPFSATGPFACILRFTSTAIPVRPRRFLSDS